MLTSLRVKKACIERLKRCLEVNSVLGNLLPLLDVQTTYAKKKRSRNKGLGWYGKMKFALRNIFVNRSVMRKASVLKQNKYREK